MRGSPALVPAMAGRQDERQWGGQAPQEPKAYMGPIRLPGGQGTLSTTDRNDIWQEYGVSACVRWRQQWAERCLTLSGPSQHLANAQRMALERIRANGTEGGRAEDPAVAELRRQNGLLCQQLNLLQQQLHTTWGATQQALNLAKQASKEAHEAHDKAEENQERLTELENRKRKRRRGRRGERERERERMRVQMTRLLQSKKRKPRKKRKNLEANQKTPRPSRR